jgi:hypothetical protein
MITKWEGKSKLKKKTGARSQKTEWTPDSSYWILDPGYWMLDTESRMLVA